MKTYDQAIVNLINYSVTYLGRRNCWHLYASGKASMEPIGDKSTIWRCDDYESGLRWAEKLSERFNLELVCDAMPC